MKIQHYQMHRIGSLGDAQNMLIAQHAFPVNLKNREAGESFAGEDHDRLLEWNRDYFVQCLDKHLHTGDMGIGQWVRTAAPEKILAFLTDVYAMPEMRRPKAVWTGYRILLTINRANGGSVYTLDVFAKNPDSKTKVEDFDAANHRIMRESCLGGQPKRGESFDQFKRRIKREFYHGKD